MHIRSRRHRKAVHRLLIISLLAAALGLAHASAQAQDAAGGHQQAAAQGGADQPAGNAWITTKVKAALMANQDVSGLAISVATTDGVVSLSGELDTQAEIDRAVAVASGIEGVLRVDASGLTVRGAASSGSQP